jgi:hypothetical protein
MGAGFYVRSERARSEFRSRILVSGLINIETTLWVIEAAFQEIYIAREAAREGRRVTCMR